MRAWATRSPPSRSRNLRRKAWQTGRVATEQRLDGGNQGGAVRVGDTVRRVAGPWTPAVHALLAHLASRTSQAARARWAWTSGAGRYSRSCPGETVGSTLPWPGWAHDAGTLVQVGELAARLPRRGGGLRATGRGPLADGRGLRGTRAGHRAQRRRAVQRGMAGRAAGRVDRLGHGGPRCRARTGIWPTPRSLGAAAHKPGGGPGRVHRLRGPARAARLFLDSYGYRGRRPGSWTWCGTGSGRTWPGCAAWVPAGDPLFTRIVSRGGAGDLETALAELGQVGQQL